MNEKNKIMREAHSRAVRRYDPSYEKSKLKSKEYWFRLVMIISITVFVYTSALYPSYKWIVAIIALVTLFVQRTNLSAYRLECDNLYMKYVEEELTSMTQKFVDKNEVSIERSRENDKDKKWN